jgi:hypothetical protein
MKNIALALFLVIIASQNTVAENQLVEAVRSKCVHGLHKQPGGGPFSVFLFCDDALGSNIGVINTAPGAGPGAIALPGPKIWDKWDVNDRFWQEPEWSTDIISFAWSPDLKFLYVATSHIYGEGGLYKLDLVKRTYTKLLPKGDAQQENKHGYQFEITAINRHSGEVSVRYTFFNASTNKSEIINEKLK